MCGYLPQLSCSKLLLHEGRPFARDFQDRKLRLKKEKKKEKKKKKKKKKKNIRH